MSSVPFIKVSKLEVELSLCLLLLVGLEKICKPGITSSLKEACRLSGCGIGCGVSKTLEQSLFVDLVGVFFWRSVRSRSVRKLGAGANDGPNAASASAG